MTNHAPLDLTKVEVQLEHGLVHFKTLLRLLFESCTNAGAEHDFFSSMANMLRLLSLKVNNSGSNVSDSNIENHGSSVTTTGVWTVLVLWEAMLHLLSRKLNNSWSRVSVSCMANHAPPVVTRVGQLLERVLYLFYGKPFSAFCHDR